MDLKTLLPFLKIAIAFLDHHSGGVLAAVTTVYAFFTVLLWRATNRQANISRQIFEASHRPWLSLKLGQGRPTPRRTMTVSITNEGSNPALITYWNMSLRLKDRRTGLDLPGGPLNSGPPDRNLIPPRGELSVQIPFEFEGGERPGYELKATVHYQGIGPWTYWATLSAQDETEKFGSGQVPTGRIARLWRWITSRTKRGTG